jgi:hypothetical protein
MSKEGLPEVHKDDLEMYQRREFIATMLDAAGKGILLIPTLAMVRILTDPKFFQTTQEQESKGFHNLFYHPKFNEQQEIRVFENNTLKTSSKSYKKEIVSGSLGVGLSYVMRKTAGYIERTTDFEMAMRDLFRRGIKGDSNPREG